MSTLAPSHPPLRLLERPPRRAAPVVTPPAPTWMERLDAWLARLPEPRNRFGPDAHI
jgi:hypothetical protein